MITFISNPRWGNVEKTLIDVTIILNEKEMPYTVSSSDPDQSVLWNSLINETHGSIEPYSILVGVIEAVAPPTYQEAFDAKGIAIKDSLNKSIALVRGTTVENLASYEAKLNRLSGIAFQMKSNPSKFFGKTFDGVDLPSIDTELFAIADKFLGRMAIESEKIEDIVKTHDAKWFALGKATTVSEIDSIAV